MDTKTSSNSNQSFGPEESQLLLDLIYDSADIGMCLTDKNRRFVRVNKVYCKMYGYTEEELLGSDFTMVLPEEARGAASKLHDDYIEGKTDETAGDWQVRRKDGSIMDVHVTAGRMKRANGEIFKVTTVTDVTAQKERTRALEEALASKEAFVKEVHHRVKNNLSIVSGLLQIQSEKVEHLRGVQPLFSESINRIRTLANIHERLYRKEGVPVIQINDYLNELLQMLLEERSEDAPPCELKVELVPLELNIEQSICCGLIVNEAVSNSLKHGVGTGRGDKLEVSLRQQENSARYVLEILDNGPGFPETMDVANSNTLGLQLIRNLSRQLPGDLAMNSNSGAMVRIEFDRITPKD